jgi:hypothetical protein
MNAKPAKPSPISDASRCAQRFANGKRCTYPARPYSSFCPSHARAEAARRQAADLVATLTGGLDEFKSPAAISDFLSRLLLLLAQDRVSPRRGAVMAYTASLLLRAVSATAEEKAEKENPQNRPVTFIWDLPCPPHERTEPKQS